MFPYDYILHISEEKSNQSSVIIDCTVNDNGSLFSSCVLTFVFYYVLPLSIMGLCYSRLSSHVRHSSARLNRQLVSIKFSLDKK